MTLNVPRSALSCLFLFACDPGHLDDAGQMATEPGFTTTGSLDASSNERPIVFSANADPVAVVQSAVNEAIRDLNAGVSSERILVFPAGTFAFHHEFGPAIRIEGLQRGSLTLRGSGVDSTTFDRATPIPTTLAFHSTDQYGILVSQAHRVTLERLHLTRDELLTTQGEVTGVDAGLVRFRTHQGFRSPVGLVNAPLALDNARTLIKFEGPPGDPRLAPDSVSLKLCDGGAACGPAITEVNEREFLVRLESSALPPLVEGDQVALKAKAGRQTVRAEDSDDFTVRRVRFTRPAAVSVAVHGLSNRTMIDQVQILRAPAISGRVPFFAGPGGGPQVTALRDGPTIQGCDIEGTTDDAIAVFSHDPMNPMSGALITGNTIRDGQGRGINITQSRDGRCVGNFIFRCQNPSIQLKSNQTAAGSPGVVGWRITHNELTQPWTDPAIFLTLENGVPSAGLHDGNVIADNVVFEAARDNPFVQVSHTTGISIARNIIVSYSNRRDAIGKGLGAFPDGGVPLVYIEEAATVDGRNNTTAPTSRPFWAQARRMDAGVTMEWSIDAGR